MIKPKGMEKKKNAPVNRFHQMSHMIRMEELIQRLFIGRLRRTVNKETDRTRRRRS